MTTNANSMAQPSPIPGSNKANSSDNSRRLDVAVSGMDVGAVSRFDNSARVPHLVVGNRELHSYLAEIRELRRRCGQEDDLTTEPEYFIAANTLANRRCAAVLIRRERELEACVFFSEHTRLGVGLGLFRGGDYIGESLVAGPESYRVHYVHLATAGTAERAAYSRREPQRQSFSDACMEVMGPASNFSRFSGTGYSTSCLWRALTRACWPAWDHAPGAALRESASNWKKARRFNFYRRWIRIRRWK